MKKIIICLNFIIVFLLCSCIPTYKFNNFFSNKVLNECNVIDMPRPIDAKNIDATSNNCICFETTSDGFYINVLNVYKYLKNKDFKYFGIEGEVLSSLFGAMPEYAFYYSDSLDDHVSINYRGFKDENCYVFVWAKKINEANLLLDDFSLTIKYNDGICSIELDYSKTVLTSYRLKEERLYTVGSFFPWLEKGIDSLSCETISNKINTVIDINKENINNFINPSCLVKEFNGDINTDEFYDFYYEIGDDVYKISIVDGYLYFNEKYYVSEDGIIYDTFKTNDNFTYTFLDESLYDVYRKYNVCGSICLKDISYIKSNLIYDDYIYSFESIYGDIKIYSEILFSIDNYYYEVISIKNFSHLF